MIFSDQIIADDNIVVFRRRLDNGVNQFGADNAEQDLVAHFIGKFQLVAEDVARHLQLLVILIGNFAL